MKRKPIPVGAAVAFAPSHIRYSVAESGRMAAALKRGMVCRSRPGTEYLVERRGSPGRRVWMNAGQLRVVSEAPQVADFLLEGTEV